MAVKTMSVSRDRALAVASELVKLKAFRACGANTIAMISQVLATSSRHHGGRLLFLKIVIPCQEPWIFI